MKALNFLIIANLVWLTSTELCFLESGESQQNIWRTAVCNANPQYATGFKINCSGNTIQIEFSLPNQQTRSVEIVRLGQRVSNTQLEIPINIKSKNLIIRNVTNEISKYKIYDLRILLGYEVDKNALPEEGIRYD